VELWRLTWQPYMRQDLSDLAGFNKKRVRAICRFRHITYQTNFSVPDWALSAVYFYIFPERFRNGNVANDPKPGVTKYQVSTSYAKRD
jgi:hypothetical protein